MEMFKKLRGWFKEKSFTEVINLETFGSDFDTTETAFRLIDKDRKKKKRLPANPVEIIHEIENGVDFPLKNIKAMITELKGRVKFVKETMEDDAKEEQRAIEMLKARLKYPKYSHMFRWKTTTNAKIQKVLDKYELVHRGIREYMRNIPPQAITSMKLYSEILKKVSKEKPNFTIIAPTEYFKDPKNDPILLADSPFGAFYYILGAWDKEISIVTELLDGEELVVDKNGNGKFKRKNGKSKRT